MSTDNDDDGQFLTFGQRQGITPLPRQLNKEDMPNKLRAKIWILVGGLIDTFRESDGWGTATLSDIGQTVIGRYYVDVLGEFSDRVPQDFDSAKEVIRKVVAKGSYVDVFDLLQFLLEIYKTPPKMLEHLDSVLRSELSAYRVVGGSKIVAVSSEEEAETISRAIDSTSKYGALGARSHIRKAIDALNAGNFADSVHESISAVESLAKVLSSESKSSLSKALGILGKSTNIHGGMKDAFTSLYGYTSDEKGIRHALLFKDKADVDEADALFMIGACSAFVSYMISRAADAGISLSDT